MTVHQDVEVSVAILPKDNRIDYPLQAERHAWLQVIRGGVSLIDKMLKEADGAAISDEKILNITAVDTAEILLFDLA